MVERLTPEQARMVEENTRLVWWWVNKLGGRYESDDERDEMYADGVFGLIRAVQKFDPSRGFTFSTYAKAWLHQSITRGRWRREDPNKHRAQVRGAAYLAPVSLEAELGDDLDFHDLLPALDDTERSALAAVELDSTIGGMAARCTDDLDREVLACLVNQEPARLADAAERHGKHPGTGRYRRDRMLRMAREATGAA